MTDPRNEAIAEFVLGWIRVDGDEECPWRTGVGGHPRAEPPDFLHDCAGAPEMLLDQLAQHGREVTVRYSIYDQYRAGWTVTIEDITRFDTDRRAALAEAALVAYGWPGAAK